MFSGTSVIYLESVRAGKFETTKYVHPRIYPHFVHLWLPQVNITDYKNFVGEISGSFRLV